MSGVPGAPPVIDYEGSAYRTDFWEGQGRNYEDAAERLALRDRLLELIIMQDYPKSRRELYALGVH